ncbi:MBL fold metallo-hydrolase [Gracilaria domingensis]|nr:MBL fold metallo-hydrolase [Gracilaria domingensis]
MRTIFTRSLSAYDGDIVFVSDGTSPLPGITFLLFPGHTPGHSVVEIDVGGDKKIVCVGDAWFSQPDQLRHPEWVRPVETDGLQGFRSRVSLMAGLSRTTDLVLAFHEQFPGLGHIVNTTQGFDWVPMFDVNRDVVYTQCS